MNILPVRIQCLTSRTGILIFNQDIRLRQYPPSAIQGQELSLKPGAPAFFAKDFGYYCDKKYIVFYLSLEHVERVLYHPPAQLLVAGEFNQWMRDITYALHWQPKAKAWMLKVPKSNLPSYPFAFKFVTLEGQWIEPWEGCTNITRDAQGNRNLMFVPHLTGNNIFHFTVKSELDFTEPLIFESQGKTLPVDILPWLSTLTPDKPLGVTLWPQTTEFVCFAPRAKKVEVKIFNDHTGALYSLTPQADGIWSVTVPQNCAGYAYLYRIWNPHLQEVVDPYAVQLASPKGPGLIRALPQMEETFMAPQVKDLTLLEVHVRDLLGTATEPKKGSVFQQLQPFLSQNNYVTNLGVNCVEFMPLTAFDAEQPETYQWGYMPAHYFSLAPNYGTPEEFQACVKILHEQGIAVIMDVVFNHAGIMNDLMRWDSTYYFRHDAGGNLTNGSGCGNDLQTEMPQVKRLICDSLLHFLNTYHVDGFRFDLAELLGLDTLNFIEKTLKAHKPNVILIAEPWSFCGHIAHALKESHYHSWNDGYRDFLWNYVQGQGNVEGLKYFLSGSTAFLCRKTQQSINYTESHDDYCWYDRLPGGPELKRRQTHCMFSALLLSCGLPMLAEGQDFLRSKNNVRNTYNRGDLNALNYSLLEQHAATHQYVQQLLKLRASPLGKVIKIRRPDPNYFQYFYVPNTSALGILWNANHQCGEAQLLFFINPHDLPATFQLPNFSIHTFVGLANTDAFFKKPRPTLPATLELRPYSCAIFTNAPQLLDDAF